MLPLAFMLHLSMNLEVPFPGWSGQPHCLQPSGPGGLHDYSLKSCSAGTSSHITPGMKIGIVGGGPGGVTMAKLLYDKGFHDLTLFEANSYIGGKSKAYRGEESPNDAYELGTCYMGKHYACVMHLADEMFMTTVAAEETPRQVSSLDAIIADMSPPSYGSASTWYADYAFRKYNVNPMDFQQRLVEDIQSYSVAWVGTMGPMRYMFPQQDSVDFSKLNVTFLEWLEERELYAFISILTTAMTGQGYGDLGTTPAFYGLQWMHPNSLALKGTGFVMLQEGFPELWRRLISSTHAKVHLNSPVTSVVRNSEQAVVTVNGSEHVFDWIVFAIPMPSGLKVLDSTPEEIEVFERFTFTELVGSYSRLRNLGVLPDDVALFSWVDHYLAQTDTHEVKYNPITKQLSNSTLLRDGDSHPWTLRAAHNIKSFADTGVIGALQISAVDESDESLWQKTREGLAPYSLVIEEQLVQERWQYFPRKNNAEILEGKHPWKIWDMQGAKRTWFVGSYTNHENVASILDYNLQLVNTHLCSDTVPETPATPLVCDTSEDCPVGFSCDLHSSGEVPSRSMLFSTVAVENGVCIVSPDPQP